MKSAKMLSQKEKKEEFISKWAFGILFALAIELLVYVFILNIVPTMVNKTSSSSADEISAYLNSEVLVDEESNSIASLNPLYRTERYYTTNGYFKSAIENPTHLIYYYNMILLVASILLILYYLVNIMENTSRGLGKKFKEFLKKEWPFTLLLIFMLWVFISSLLARDSYRSFVGCFNLKDGYLSFMMYGSILVCSMLLLRNKEKYRNILINTFLITATILAIITLWNYFYLNFGNFEESVFYEVKPESIDSKKEQLDGSDLNYAYLITYGSNPENYVVTIGELLFGNGGMEKGKNFLIVTKRILGETNSGVFHNSNHYGYYLSICVIVAAVLAIKSDGFKSMLYCISYAIMLYMAIINNTLGAYLGIGASIIFMIVYSLIMLENKDGKINCIKTLLVLAIFIILSCTTVNVDKENIVYKNLNGIYNDFVVLVNSTKNNEEETNDISENQADTNEEKEVSADDIGSGRGILWKDAAIMATQKPFFGYGLENILYEYNEQFGVGEGRSHSLVLQLAATTGIIGMLLYVVAIAAIWIRKLPKIKEWNMYELMGMSVIISYIISSMVGNSGFYTSGYFYIFVGLVVLSNEGKIDEKKK